MTKLGLWDGRVATLPYQDGYAFKAVQSTTARDAIPADHRFKGLEVLVLDQNIKYALRSDLTTWDTSEIVPDYTIKTRLEAAALSGSETIYMYIASTGSDTTGDGSESRPFRQLTRVIQAIPPNCKGFIQVECLDAGPFDANIQVPDLKCDEYLNINVVGAGSSILDISGMAAGTRDSNSAGGTKVARRRHSAVGAHAAISNGSHWIKTIAEFGGDPWVSGYVIDPDGSTSPDISIVDVWGNTDITTGGFTEIHVVPFTTVFAGSGGSAGLTMVPQGAVSLNFNGISWTDTLITMNGNIQAYGCYFAGTVRYFPTEAGQNMYSEFGDTLIIFADAARDVHITGLFSGIVYISGFVYLTGICRNTETTKVQVGFGSLTAPRREASVILRVDFEQASVYCVNAYGGSVRIYDDGNFCSTDGTSSTFFAISNFSDIIGTTVFPTIYGYTTSVPVIIGTHSNSVAFTAPGWGRSPYLRNNTSPGEDVRLGGGTTYVTVSFSDLPASELNFHARAE